MSRKYKHPPIEEAIAEFRFAPVPEWDPTLPGKLSQHPRISAHYTGKPRTQKIMEAEFQAAGEQATNIAVRQAPDRVQLINEDETNVVSIGLNVLSVSTLRPYDGWEMFRPRIEEAFKAYIEIAEPTAVIRIGVRYINKIVHSGPHLDVGRFIQYGPPSLENLPISMAGFFNRVEYGYDDDKAVKVLLTQATVEPPTEDQFAFIVDLDVIWEGEECVNAKNIMEIVGKLHEREGQAFEAIITDVAREVFDA